MTNEEIYDRDISPLMAQIIGLCKQHEIPFLASFQLDEEGLACTSAWLPKTCQKKLHNALDLIKDGFVAFTITTKKTD